MNGDGSLDLAEQASAPDTPPSGMVRLFADQTDGHLKQKDDQGDVIDLAQAGSGSSMPDGAYLRILLHDETLASDGTFDVTDISQDYDHLEFILTARSTYTDVTKDLARFYFNNDTTEANYCFAAVVVDDGSHDSGSGDSAFVGNIPSSHASNSAYAVGVLHGFIYNYTSTDFWKVRRIENTLVSSDSVDLGRWVHGAWESNSAISRITLQATNGSWVTGSRLQIFGLKAYSTS
jgi:hypothetical protein